jgi:hypothetical protein
MIYKALTVVLAVILACLQGCATKTYGRQGALTEFEASTLTCREIDLEIARTDGFVQRVNAESKFDGKDVLAFLGDFGIGNSMEKSAALESATTRLSNLNTLRAKRCPGVSGTAPTALTPAAPAAPAAAAAAPVIYQRPGPSPGAEASRQPMPGMNDGKAIPVAPGTCGWVDGINYVCRK